MRLWGCVILAKGPEPRRRGLVIPPDNNITLGFVLPQSTRHSLCVKQQYRMAAALQLESAPTVTTMFGFQARQEDAPSPTISPVTNHVYIGCYADTNSTNRLLQGGNMTTTDIGPGGCCIWCAARAEPYSLCGVASGSECYCGLSSEYSATSVDSCTEPCSGNTLDRCGGESALDVYNVTLRPTPLPIDGCKYLGCFKDRADEDGRVLQATSTGFFSDLEPVRCCNWCAEANPQHRYCGVEWWACFCGSTLVFNETAHASECDMPCGYRGDAQCGSGFRLNLYEVDVKEEVDGGEKGGEESGSKDKGLSTEAKISLGVGLGIGIPSTITTVWMCWRRRY